MCGCYLFVDSHPKIDEILTKAHRADPSVLFQMGDVFPGQLAPILIGHQNKIFSRFARWGFHQKIINARSESVEEKSVFCEDFKNHRALVPVSGFYEWNQDKQKYLFKDQEKPILYLAAIYNDKHEFTIITAPARAPVQQIHHRMPVMILPEHFHDWFFDSRKARQLLKNHESIVLKASSMD